MNYTLFPDYILSSNIPNLVLSGVTGQFVTVQIELDQEEMFNEKLYPYNGRIELQNIESIVMPYIYEEGYADLNITIQEEGGSAINIAQSTLYYCAADVECSAQDFFQNYFLTLLDGMKLTAEGRDEFLAVVGSEPMKAYCYYDDGSRTEVGVSSINRKYFKLFNVSPSLFKVSGKNLTGYNIVCGGRMMRYQIDGSLQEVNPAIVFENSFGIQETLYCVGTQTADSKFERSFARVGGKKRMYQNEETRSFTCDTGFLPQSQQLWINDLMRSKSVNIMVYEDGAWEEGKEIVITESNTATTNNDDFIFRASFNYELAQKNHNVLSERRIGKVFDATFDYTFN